MGTRAVLGGGEGSPGTGVAVLSQDLGMNSSSGCCDLPQSLGIARLVKKHFKVSSEVLPLWHRMGQGFCGLQLGDSGCRFPSPASLQLQYKAPFNPDILSLGVTGFLRLFPRKQGRKHRQEGRRGSQDLEISHMSLLSEGPGWDTISSASNLSHCSPAGIPGSQDHMM